MISVLPSEKVAAPSTAHLLPCDVKYSGAAPVSTYFKPRAAAGSDVGEQQLEAHFRGRKLHGVVLETPAGYTGAVLQDTLQSSIADGEARRWMHRGAVESFAYWKHDERANGDEPVLKAMRWTRIASALHGDHTEEAPAEAPADAPPASNEV